MILAAFLVLLDFARGADVVRGMIIVVAPLRSDHYLLGMEEDFVVVVEFVADGFVAAEVVWVDGLVDLVVVVVDFFAVDYFLSAVADEEALLPVVPEDVVEAVDVGLFCFLRLKFVEADVRLQDRHRIFSFSFSSFSFYPSGRYCPGPLRSRSQVPFQ